MTQALFFLGGFVTGVLVTVLVLFWLINKTAG